MAKIESICMKLERGVGFSKGSGVGVEIAAAIGSNILIATWEATGPCGMVCSSTFCSTITGTFVMIGLPLASN